MKKSKQPNVPKEFPTTLVEEYTNICDRLKKYETALMKRFAPKLSEIHRDFIRLANVFMESEIDEYAALCYLGAARCERLQHNFLAEQSSLIKAAESFTIAYNRRLELGYPDGDEEFRQGALKCYNDLLTSSHLTQDSPLRAAIIRQLKKIDPHTEQTSTFESPAHRYEDLTRAANVDIEEKNYQGALNKLTDIFEDIHERKVQNFYNHVLERGEIMRLLLLVYLNMPPATLAACNVALLDRYKMQFDGIMADRVKESALDPELHFMFRAFFQSIQLRNLDFLRESFNDIGMLPFLTSEQIKLLHLVFDKFEYEFMVERGEQECKCFPTGSSDEEEEEGTANSSKTDPNEGASTSKEMPKSKNVKIDDQSKETGIEAKVQMLDLKEDKSDTEDSGK